MEKLSLILLLVLTACAYTDPIPTITPTPTSDDALLMQMLQGEVEARATQRAADQQLIIFQAGQTATALITGATSTEQSAAETRTVWRVTVAAGEVQGTSTAQAGQVQGTATAQAGNAQATSTAAAAGTSTQIAYLNGTATVQSQQTSVSLQETSSAPLLSAQYTAVAAQAESASLAATRERTTNQLWAWTPLILIFVGLGAGVYYLWKSGKIGIVNADDNGIMPTIIFTDTMRVLRPDLMPTPMIEANAENIVAAPDQADVTRRAQAVQAIAQLPPGYQRQALDIASGSFGAASSAPKIEIVDENIIQGWVDDVEGQV
jgi:hypothetical protein